MSIGQLSTFVFWGRFIKYLLGLLKFIHWSIYIQYTYSIHYIHYTYSIYYMHYTYSIHYIHYTYSIHYIHIRTVYITYIIHFSYSSLFITSQPTIYSDHIKMKYIWGPHGKPCGDPTLKTHRDLQKVYILNKYNFSIFIYDKETMKILVIHIN